MSPRGVGRRRRLSEELLSAYLDDELAAPRRSAVEAQLAASEEWRAALADLRSARDALRGLGWRDAPGGVWDEILAAVGADAALEAASASRPRSSGVTGLRSVPRWATATAGVAAAAFVLAVAVVPGERAVRPDVATLSNAHAVRASLGNDPVSALAGAAVPIGAGR